jgi:hypothetical protein
MYKHGQAAQRVVLVSTSAPRDQPVPHDPRQWPQSCWGRHQVRVVTVVACLLVIAAGATLGGLAAAGKLSKPAGEALSEAEESAGARILALGRPAFQGALQPYRDPSQLKAPLTADVVVIGAGMSGLAAARQLVDEGLDVLVLEGRVSAVAACAAQSPLASVLWRSRTLPWLSWPSPLQCMWHPQRAETEKRGTGPEALHSGGQHLLMRLPMNWYIDFVGCGHMYSGGTL